MADSIMDIYQYDQVIGSSTTDAIVAATADDGARVLLQIFRVPLRYETFARDLEWSHSVVARQRHPAILPITGVELYDGQSVLFRLPYTEGYTLHQHLATMRKENGAFSEDAALAFVRNLALTLAPAARLGMMHRTLHAHHILVRPDGEPAVLGLEIPGPMANELLASYDDELKSYLSPEQRRGLMLDARSNIYTLGRILYELLATGAADVEPGPGSERPPLEEIRPELEHGTALIASRCLQEESWARYQSYDELLSALGVEPADRPAPAGASRGAEAEPMPAQPARRASSGWLRTLPLVAGFVGLVLLIGGYVVAQAGLLSEEAELLRSVIENVEENDFVTPAGGRARYTASPTASLTSPPKVVVEATGQGGVAYGAAPTATATASPTHTPTLAPTQTPSPTPVPATPSSTPSPTPLPPTPSFTPTATAVFIPPTATPTASPSATPVPPTPTFTSSPPPPPPPATSPPTATTAPPTATPPAPSAPTLTPPPADTGP